MTLDIAGLSLLMGAAVGVVLALTGAGGGILAVPLLVFGLHLRMAEAAPIGLLAVGLAAALGALLALREGIVRYRAALMIGLTGMAVAPLGVRLSQLIPNGPVMALFALVLAWVAWRNLRQGRRAPSPVAPPSRRLPVCAMNPTTGRLTWRAPCTAMLGLTGALSGLLSGLLGVGGGFVIVPMLSEISNVPARGVVATSMAVIALVSVGGVLGAATQGSLDWAVAAPFAAGAVLALLAGRQFSSRWSGVRLQQAFGLLAGTVSVLMLVRAWGG
ncbi:sulfite exporter TauE/SafE family protein [Pelomonas sp. P7]|uniref:Probable membrane transporter protein n=1 Tax=Pelomonas caseinilytica TaxID=2906763 RepID=A0ABS8XEB5_9BURK|nr:sulfite exporter TauE/SafE family protein [Pelomonas sp. P7]MCE4537273.1 sulfite exporter TauE/SafE family protein [Pelomonas sp. P7]